MFDYIFDGSPDKPSPGNPASGLDVSTGKVYYSMPATGWKLIGASSSLTQFAGVPTGSCVADALAVDTTTGNLYDCLSGTWNLVSAGGGNTTSGTLVSGNLVSASGAHAIQDTGVAVSGLVPTSRTVAGHALTGNVTVSASDVGLGNVTNDVQTKAAVVPNTLPTAGQILAGNAGGTAYAPVAMSGDATLASTGAITIANNAVTTAKVNNGAITEVKLTLADNTTGNVSTSAHGFAPKAPNDATKFLDGTGNYSTPAGSGTVNSGTANQIAKYATTGTAVSGDSALTDDGTTLTYSGSGGIATSGSNGGIDATEGTKASLTPALNHDLLAPDSTVHRWQMNNNNGGWVNVVASGVDINTSDQVTATHLAAALPINQGGTGTTSTLTGLVRGSGSAMTAAELSGDVTTSGSNATTIANSAVTNAKIANSTIDLTAKVTGILPAANGGTANGFTAFSGPASTTKTFTLPNASATVLTDNAAVTAAQGGSGQTSYTKGDILVASGATTLTKVGVGSDTQVLTADSTQTAGVKWAAASGGGVSGQYVNLYVGSPLNSNFTMNDQNQTRVWGVGMFIQNTIVTSGFAYNISTADTSGLHHYDIGLYNGSGTLVASLGATAGSTFSATTGLQTAAWSQGSVTLNPGKYYLAYTTDCSSGCAVITSGVGAFTYASYVNTGNATSGGGLLSSITAPADSWAVSNAPIAITLK